jgi:hypothetical protein
MFGITKINIGALGLLFDIYGSFWLVKSIIWRSRKQIELETGTYFDNNPYALISQIGSKWSGWYGFTFLALGFLGQFLNQIHNFYITISLIIWIIAALIVVGFVFNNFIKRELNKKIPKEFLERYGKI